MHIDLSTLGTRRKDTGREETSLNSLKRMVSEVVRSDDFDCPRPPDIAMRVLNLSHQPDVALPDIARVVELDPFIAGQFVGLANSPIYRGSGTISTIDRAIAQIGLRASRDLVFAIAMRGRIFRSDDYKDLMKDLWHHAAGCARVSELLAKMARLDVGYTFLGGLLHDIGKPVLLSVLTDLKKTGVEVNIPGLDSATAVMTALHAEVGALVTSRWELPEPIIAAVRWHHYIDKAIEHPLLPRLVAAANLICHRHGIGCEADDTPIAKHPSFAELQISEKRADEIIKEIGDKTLEADFLPF